MAEFPGYIDPKSERISLYARNKKLFEGKAWEVFGLDQIEFYRNFNPSGAKIQYISYDFATIMTNTIADLIWAEPPTFTFASKSNQEWFDDWRIKQSFNSKMYQLSQTSSHAGDGLVKLVVDRPSPVSPFSVCLYEVDPGCWYPEISPENPAKPAKSHTIYFERELGENAGSAVLLEIHGYGEIEYRAFLKKSEKYTEVDVMAYFSDLFTEVLIDTFEKEKGKFVYKTNVDSPLVFHLPNFKVTGEAFGVSDYTTSIVSKIYAINQNYNQIQDVLRKHANPKMQVPSSVIQNAIAQARTSDSGAGQYGFNDSASFVNALNTDEEGVRYEIAARIVRKLEFFSPRLGDTTETKFITWDGNLAESREQIKNLKQDLCIEGQIAPALVDPEVAIGNITGVGMKRLALTSLNKAKRKITNLTDFMQHMVYAAQQLAIETDGVETKMTKAEWPTIQFKDGLVDDVKEIIEKNQMLLDNGLTSKVDAIAEIFETTKKDAEAIYQSALEEAQARSASFLGPTDFTPEEPKAAQPS